MPIQLKHRSPTGETRPWTLKEVIQGRPVDRPTHPMLIHFPIAFYIGALALDVLSRVGTFPAAPLAATWSILGAFGGFDVVERDFERNVHGAILIFGAFWAFANVRPHRIVAMASNARNP